MNNIVIMLLSLSAIFLPGCDFGSQNSAKKVSNMPLAESLSSATQSQLDVLAKTLQVNYRLITNIPSDKCDSEQADGNCFEVELSFTATESVIANGWQIYFSQISPIQSFVSDQLSVTHINGDLHRIALKDNFTGFSASETKTLTFRANFWMLTESDALPNYIITADNLDPRVIKSTVTVIDKDSQLELIPFVEPFTDVNKQFKRTANDSTKWLRSEDLFARNEVLGDAKVDVSTRIIPTPKKIVIDQENRQLNISQGLAINLGNVDTKTVSAAIKRLARLGVKENLAGKPLLLSVKEEASKKNGAYELTILEDRIIIVGTDASGVFNGIQSLASLLTLGKDTLPLVKISDEPHYQFRGLLVDVARNFHSKTFILNLLDQMAAYKLNKLHLHLGDDEGWRLEIPGLPELTDVGSKRCFDQQEQSCLIAQLGAGLDTQSQVNGYYTVADYQEILVAASARHIQVIPSLDMPGHSRAAMKAMTARYNKYIALEEDDKANEFQLDDLEDETVYTSVQFYNDNTINVCLESSYAFVTEVMTKVKAMHAEVDHPLTRYHIGADETAGAWLASPACKAFVANNDKGVSSFDELGAYFVERVAGILAGLDIEAAAWSDGLEHTRKDKMPAIVQANAWGYLPWGTHKQTHELTNRNWQIVISTPDVMYFDFPYEADPKEHGYYWAARHTNTEKIFQFMPDNLPVHAEFWLDREDNPFVSDDRYANDSEGNPVSIPLTKGKKFLGLQGQLWSENTRSDSMAEHKIYPRLLALAERAWHLPNWAVPYNYDGYKYSRESHVFDEARRNARDAQWKIFANTLGQKELPKLDLFEVNYRLPTVGATVNSSILKTNSAFPGLTIEYQEYGKRWKVYEKPVMVNSVVKLRSVSSNGKRSSRVTQVSK